MTGRVFDFPGATVALLSFSSTHLHEIGCCEFQGWQSESTDGPKGAWWSPLFLSLSLTIYLPTSLSSMYLIYLSFYLSLSFSLSSHYLSTYLPIYLCTYLPTYLSISLSLSPVYLSSCLPVCLSICLSGIPVYLWCSEHSVYLSV